MYFEVVGDISEIETIATGHGIQRLTFLRKRYGGRNWRKPKVWQQFAWPAARFGWLKYTGMKPTASGGRA